MFWIKSGLPKGLTGPDETDKDRKERRIGMPAVRFEKQDNIAALLVADKN